MVLDVIHSFAPDYVEAAYLSEREFEWSGREEEEEDLAVGAFLPGVSQKTVIGKLMDSLRTLATWKANEREHQKVGV